VTVSRESLKETTKIKKHEKISFPELKRNPCSRFPEGLTKHYNGWYLYTPHIGIGTYVILCIMYMRIKYAVITILSLYMYSLYVYYVYVYLLL